MADEVIVRLFPGTGTGYYRSGRASPVSLFGDGL